MSQCHSGSCNTNSHGSSCHEECGCNSGCCASGCKCGPDCSCRSKECGSCEDFSKKLIQMADDAWMCLLKEKIRARVEEMNGEQLDELANLVASANHERWKEKLKAKEACNSFHEKIDAFFKKNK